jgi:hypothetical protein
LGKQSCIKRCLFNLYTINKSGVFTMPLFSQVLKEKRLEVQNHAYAQQQGSSSAEADGNTFTRWGSVSLITYAPLYCIYCVNRVEMLKTYTPLLLYDQI